MLRFIFVLHALFDCGYQGGEETVLVQQLKSAEAFGNDARLFIVPNGDCQ